MSEVRIGTSGWSYPHWVDVFYPEDKKATEWLPYYAQFFDTVELNVTFYRLPEKNIFQKWYDETPENFMFVTKGSRLITHQKKLLNCEEPLNLFSSRVSTLKDKLRAVLWQLPPNFGKNPDRLEDFLKLLSKDSFIKDKKHAFEFRNESWLSDDIYSLLKKYKAALVIADSKEFPKAEVITTDFTYIRFHGGKEPYSSKYNDKELEGWGEKIKNWSKKGLDIYAYFNNDAEGYAIDDAMFLKGLVAGNK